MQSITTEKHDRWGERNIVNINGEVVYCYGDLYKAMIEVDDGFCNMFIAGSDRDFEWTMADFKTKEPRWVEIVKYMMSRYGKENVQEIQLLP